MTRTAARITLLRLAPVVAASATIGLVAACGASSAASTVTRADSSGVELVDYAGPDRSMGWRFDSLLSIGGAEEGPASFYQIAATGVGADASGSLFVLDRSAMRVVVFDSTGAFVRSMGREGGGPGELQFPLAISVGAAGDVAIVDIGKRASVRFSAAGERLEQEPLPEDYSGSRFSREGATTVMVLSAGDVDADTRTDRLTRTVAGDTSTLATLEVPSSGIVAFPSCGMQLASMPPIFAPRMRWSARGPTVAVAVGTGYEVMLFTNGRLVRVIRRPIAPRTPTRADAIEELGDMRVMTPAGARDCDANEGIDARGIADAIPVVQSVGFGPFGTLWIARRGATKEDGPVDVFAETGDYLGTFPTRPMEVAALVGDDRIAAIVKDELDVERLTLFRAIRD